MNCWKTINVNREFGINRIYVVSFLIGLLSFIFLYLPFSIIHQSHELKDHGVFPLLLGLVLLPLVHNLMHILPLILINRRMKIKWHIKYKIFLIISSLPKSKMSKQTTLFSLLAPTLFLTVPGLITSYLFTDYYAYFLIFTAFNIGLSFTDFLCASKLIKAPKKCIVENFNDGFDILVR
ncbi:DUF3267 domain-containing protein [Aquibacillus albus]|uniref:DUF3267 domain-containing protein n=1 Tax=Aquibacillus albus TaxID=1168171 RepID=A0ABS2N080_9BACI|nr:DUF3267 domain-containing protein [Aquibacillus albus]MBM7571448.1 hypothetical protein [Aquibacillus albus]